MIFTDQTALDLIKEVAATDKAWHLNREESDPKKIPSFNPIFSEALEFYRRIRVHFDGRFPDFLFRERAPRESSEEFEYRKKIYKAITKAWMGRALGAVARVWNDKNFTIKWDEKSDQEYFEGEFPRYGNIWAYFEQVVTPEKLKDPNAVICFKPAKLPDNESDKVEPVGVIYHCDQVIRFEDESYCLVLLGERSMIKKGTRNVQEGRVYELYDRENIWRIIQTSEAGNKKEFEVVPMYQGGHGLDWLPAQKLKGTPLQREDEVLYESYFAGAIPSLEAALLDHSTLQVIKYAHAFPRMWQYVDKCPNPNCKSGRVEGTDDQGNFRWDECTQCEGSGKSIGSPLKVIEIALQDQHGNQKPSLPSDPIGKLEPETGVMEFLWKQIVEYLQTGYSILNIEVSNSFARGDDTALGKQIDREEFFSFLLRFSNELFELLEFAFKTIGALRNDGYVPPSIQRPTNFTIRNDEELTKELSNKDIPDFARRRILQSFNNARFINDIQAEKIFSLIYRLDKLLTKSDDQIGMLLARGIVSKKQVVLHEFIASYIEDIIKEEPKFLDQSYSEQTDVLLGLAETDVPKEATIASRIPALPE